jgi:hypothetical protein
MNQLKKEIEEFLANNFIKPGGAPEIAVVAQAPEPITFQKEAEAIVRLLKKHGYKNMDRIKIKERRK